MTQTRLSSLLEAVFNVAVGFVVSVLITAIFTVSSIARTYVLRRWFNARIHRAAQSFSQGQTS